MSPAAPAPLILWRFTDGRRGHDAQSRGLALAVAARRPARVVDVPATGAVRATLDLLSGRFAAGAALPDPDLLIGAGHGTHLPLLAARRARGGCIVLLMRPSLPTAWFDLCLIPDHDRVSKRDNVILTRGPLNAIRTGDRGGDRDLILIGGISKHCQWEEPALIAQIRAVLGTPGSWTVTDSPRTPGTTRRLLRDLAGDRYAPWESGDGLAEALAAARRVWVTADSLSMIYEALTAGAAVGVLELPATRDGNRVVEAIRRLRAERRITIFSEWRPGTELPAPPAPLA
ncbi:MAG TPA: ELM1/GtrOC1 family putative glycosyltransferase, partial [Gammaproteobacteria bacterium]